MCARGGTEKTNIIEASTKSGYDITKYDTGRWVLLGVVIVISLLSNTHNPPPPPI